MDPMDIDNICDIPDTPERIAARNKSVIYATRTESNPSVAGYSEIPGFLDEGARKQVRGRSALVIDCENGRRLSFSPGKNLCTSSKFERGNDSRALIGNSSTTNDAYLFRRTVADKTVHPENKYNIVSRQANSGKAFNAPQSSTCRGKAVVDSTGQKGHAPVPQKALPSGKLEDHHPRELVIPTNGFSYSRTKANTSISACDAYKGKGKRDDKCTSLSNIEHGKGILDESGKGISEGFHSLSSPRVIGQKRLVRNGCISLHNIAKAKQVVGNYNSSYANVQNEGASLEVGDSSCVIDIRDPVAVDNTTHRGQGGLRIHPFLSEEPDLRTTYMPSSYRSSLAHNEDTCGASNARGDVAKFSLGLDGWRNTRNRSKKICDEGQHPLCSKDDPFYVNQRHGNKGVRRDYMSGVTNGTSTDRSVELDPTGLLHKSASPGPSRAPSHVSLLEQSSRCYATNATKRKKQTSGPSSYNESSTSHPIDSEIMFIGSPERPSSSRLNRNMTIDVPCTLDPVIEIDESFQIRQSGSHNGAYSGKEDTDARARQVEADEMLAFELQEQLYNEVTGTKVSEIDADIALALQRESLQDTLPNGGHVFNPRGSLMSNVHRQSQSRSSQNISGRRGSQARLPASSRLTRLRNRTSMQSPRLSYRHRSSLFPPDMDVDMRMYILEALEAFSDREMEGNFLQVHRDFNENDYEMLLALDENNHQHSGASLDRINSLPQSIVLSDNFEEDCAICLETPSIGDTIRHLPCLHKFHRDCIDPWLSRKTSCPVCKLSIT